MGLDTVELLMSFEKEFGIDVPDYDAELIATIGDATIWFYNHLQLAAEGSPTQRNLEKKIRFALSEMGLPADFETQDLVSSVFENDDLDKSWKKFKQTLGLKIPPLNRADLNEIENEKPNLLKRLIARERPAITSNSFKQLIEWIATLNYEELRRQKKPEGLFDVLIGVMFLTYEKTGANIDELLWDASFTSDLRMD